MKRTQIAELHRKTQEELTTLLNEKKKELAKIKLDVKGGRIKNTSLLKNTRKELAQILTVLKEKAFL